MRNLKNLLYILLSIISFTAYSQWTIDSSTYESMKKRMYDVVETLSSEEFEGREAGTMGEIKSKLFIQQQFENLNLEPFYSNGSYFKSFSYNLHKIDEDHSNIEVNKKKFKLNKDFFVNSYSSSSVIYSDVVHIKYGLSIKDKEIDNYENLNQEDLKSKTFLIDVNYPEKYTFINEQNFYEFVLNSIMSAISNGAETVLLYQSENPKFQFDNDAAFQLGRLNIPVIFVTESLSKELLKSKNTKIKISLVYKLVNEVAYNVAAKIDNGAPKTIVIGGHYDHLGYGSSISRHNGKPQIHPGADDNASGIAGIIEIANLIKTQNLKNHNYIFVGFSAEEKGLIGSHKFIEDSLELVPSYLSMFNIDMIGRLDKDNPKLTLLGTGTSSLWDSLITISSQNRFEISKVESGIGGSDHTSFYLKNIPVLFFFTGLHNDYHTPKDVIELVNFSGMTKITEFMFNMLINMENLKKIDFKETKNTRPNSERSSRGISLGIMPDHTFEGKGIKVADVFENRPASNAGVVKGDIIIFLNTTEIADISEYMKALSELKPEMSVIIKVLRENKELEFNLNL